MHTYTHKYTNTHSYTYTHTHPCTHTHTHPHAHTRTHIHTQTHTYIHTGSDDMRQDAVMQQVFQYVNHTFACDEEVRAQHRVR